MFLFNAFKFFAILFLFLFSYAFADNSTHTTLKNGLNVIVKEDHRFPIAVINFSYQVGSINEEEGFTGASHFLEHLMHSRTNNLSHSNIEDFFSQHSGYYDAVTTFENTTYSISVPPKEVPAVLKFERDRITNLRLVPNDVEKERHVILQERSQRITHSPWSESSEMFQALSFPTGGYHHPIIGWEQDIKSMPIDYLRAWYKKWYVPNNLTIIVVGDVETKQVLENIKQLFESIPAKQKPHQKALETMKREGERRIDLKKDVNNALFILGFQVPKPDKASLETEIALTLLQDFLTNPEQGILTKELIQNNHLAVAVDTELDYLKLVNGYLSFYITPNKNIHFYSIKNKLLSSLNALSEEDISDQRLAELKKRYFAQHIFYQDSLSYQSKIFSKLISLNLPHNRYNDAEQALNNITKANLISLIKRYFNADSPTIIMTVRPI